MNAAEASSAYSCLGSRLLEMAQAETGVAAWTDRNRDRFGPVFHADVAMHLDLAGLCSSWRGQAVAITVRSHRLARVRAEPQVGMWLCGTDEGKAGLLVLGVVASGIRVVEPAGKHPDRASEIPALLAEAR